MLQILVLQGPNINMLGRRKASQYGTVTMDEIHERMSEKAEAIDCELTFFQSNHQGALVDQVQAFREKSNGIILNPAGLTGVGYSLRDAIEDSGLPTVEVHLSNIHAREAFRHHSCFSAIAVGQVVGFRWRGYLAALDMLVESIRESENEAG
jgi:3-dehydroquinate dehydratase-2